MQDLDGGASYYEGEFKLFLRSGNGTLENTEIFGLVCMTKSSCCHKVPLDDQTALLRPFLDLLLIV